MLWLCFSELVSDGSRNFGVPKDVNIFSRSHCLLKCLLNNGRNCSRKPESQWVRRQTRGAAQLIWIGTIFVFCL